jgi:hypothetical protein
MFLLVVRLVINRWRNGDLLRIVFGDIIIHCVQFFMGLACALTNGDLLIAAGA